MTTLIDKELFDYLDNLEREIRRKISDEKRAGFEELMHSQMANLIEAEKIFLTYVNSNGTQPVLSISPNGLPSVQSLNPDLEKMCELAEEEKSLSDVAQRFRKGIKGKNNDNKDGHLYVPVSEEEWTTEMKNYKPEQLLPQVGFAVSETEEGKFELALREDLSLRGYDQHSKEFPVLIREGKTQYHVVWNRVIDGSEKSFYVPNTALVLKGRPIKPPTKVFDDVERHYLFRKRDYRSFGGRMPLLFWKGWVPDNYSEFLNAGTNSRICITNNILDILGEVFKKQVNLKGIRKNDLEVTLAFASIPFENAPKTTPGKKDFYEIDGSEYGKKLTSKIPNRFDLVSSAGCEKIGEIEYILPYNEYHSFYGGDYYSLVLGGIRLRVLGSSILDESQFAQVQNGLKKVKKR